jgi:hypothetical protein
MIAPLADLLVDIVVGLIEAWFGRKRGRRQ